MYTLKTLVAVGVICCFVGFLVCLAIFNHICNDCLKSMPKVVFFQESRYSIGRKRKN